MAERWRVQERMCRSKTTIDLRTVWRKIHPQPEPGISTYVCASFVVLIVLTNNDTWYTTWHSKFLSLVLNLKINLNNTYLAPASCAITPLCLRLSINSCRLHESYIHTSRYSWMISCTGNASPGWPSMYCMYIQYASLRVHSHQDSSSPPRPISSLAARNAQLLHRMTCSRDMWSAKTIDLAVVSSGTPLLHTTNGKLHLSASPLHLK